MTKDQKIVVDVIRRNSNRLVELMPPATIETIKAHQHRIWQLQAQIEEVKWSQWCAIVEHINQYPKEYSVNVKAIPTKEIMARERQARS